MPTSARRPSGMPQVLPYLYYEDAAGALAFLVDAFGFSELSALRDDEGRVWSAQVSTGDGVVLIGPGMDEFGTRAVDGTPPATSRVFVYVDDVDGHAARARDRGAVLLTEVGEIGPNRAYVARDRGGHQWVFGTPLE